MILSVVKYKFSLDEPLLWMAVFALLALAAFLFQIPQEILLACLLFFFMVLIYRDPKNGIFFLLLVVPFFLGNTKRSYFWVYDVLVVGTLLSGLAHFLITEYIRDIRPSFHFHTKLIFLYAFILLLAMPLDLQSFLMDIKNTPLSKSWLRFVSGHEGKQIYYLRTLFNFISGLGLFLTVAYFFKTPKDIARFFPAALLILCLVVLFGFLFRFDIISHQGKFLSLQFYGYQAIGPGRTGITGFAYNSGYLGQFLVLFLPMAAFFTWRIKQSPVIGILSIVALCATGVQLIYTYQRGPLIALFAELVGFGAILIWLSSNRRKSFFITSCFLVGLLGLFFFTDRIFFQGVTVERLRVSFSNPSMRDQIWQVALEMFRQFPFFGIGLGRFHSFFPEFCVSAGIAFEGHLRLIRTTAHNLYFHILAEQGMIGLSVFIMLVGTLLVQSLKTLREDVPETRTIIIPILMATLGFLTFGMSQYMFYLRSIQILFWIYLGFITIHIRSGKQGGSVNLSGRFIPILVGVLFVIRMIEMYKYAAA